MADSELGAIAALIAAGEDQPAFTRLHARLGWPRGKTLVAAEVPAWIDLLAQLAARRGAASLAELAIGVVRDPDSPDRLYDLAYALIDAGEPALAASVLWRCLALVPARRSESAALHLGGDNEEVVCELVSALEAALAYRDAFAILEAHPALRAGSFLCRYLYAFNAAMIGRLDLTRATLATLIPAVQSGPEAAAPDPMHVTMHGTIARIVERADRVAGACSLDERDLRGWHYVLTGGLLLHQSPYGFAEPMRGRYAWLQDSLPRIATGMERLCGLAGAVPCVYAPPGRDHAIVARAVAHRLGVPLMPWPAVGVPAPGLVVLYDLAALDASDVARLAQRRPDQIVFAHASPWTTDAPITPDVTTLLYQSLVPPWPDDADEEPLALALAASPGLPAHDLEADEPARLAALIGRAWPPAPGPRTRLWAGGPVASNRFQ